ADLSIQWLEQVGDDQLVSRILTETLERAERLGVRNVSFEHRAVPLDRLLDLTHLRLAQRRQAKHEGDLHSVIGRKRELRLEILRKVAPHALPREELIERREGRLARGIELENALVRGDRVVGTAELFVVDARHTHVEHLSIGRIGRLFDATLGYA